MQLANASTGRSAPLRGIQGPLAPPAPRTREELLGFTGIVPVLYLLELLIRYPSQQLYRSCTAPGPPSLTSSTCSDGDSSKAANCRVSRHCGGLNLGSIFLVTAYAASFPPHYTLFFCILDL